MASIFFKIPRAGYTAQRQLLDQTSRSMFFPLLVYMIEYLHTLATQMDKSIESVVDSFWDHSLIFFRNRRNSQINLTDMVQNYVQEQQLIFQDNPEQLELLDYVLKKAKNLDDKYDQNQDKIIADLFDQSYDRIHDKLQSHWLLLMNLGYLATIIIVFLFAYIFMIRSIEHSFYIDLMFVVLFLIVYDEIVTSVKEYQLVDSILFQAFMKPKLSSLVADFYKLGEQNMVSISNKHFTLLIPKTDLVKEIEKDHDGKITYDSYKNLDFRVYWDKVDVSRDSFILAGRSFQEHNLRRHAVNQSISLFGMLTSGFIIGQSLVIAFKESMKVVNREESIDLLRLASPIFAIVFFYLFFSGRTRNFMKRENELIRHIKLSYEKIVTVDHIRKMMIRRIWEERSTIRSTSGDHDRLNELYQLEEEIKNYKTGYDSVFAIFPKIKSKLTTTLFTLVTILLINYPYILEYL